MRTVGAMCLLIRRRGRRRVDQLARADYHGVRHVHPDLVIIPGRR
jgi:hypothetical protein